MLVRNRSDGAWSSKCQCRGHRRRSDRLVAESGLLLEDYGSHSEVILEIVISKEVELCFIHRSIVLGAPRGRVTAGRAGALPARVTGRGHVRVQFKCWARGGDLEESGRVSIRREEYIEVDDGVRTENDCLVKPETG